MESAIKHLKTIPYMTSNSTYIVSYSSNYQIYVQEAVDLELEADDHVIRKEACWVNAGNALEIDGVAKLEIGKRLQHTIETKIFEKTGKKIKINTAYWYRVIHRNGWGIHSAEERAEDDEIPLGGKSNDTFIAEENIDLRRVWGCHRFRCW